MKIGWVGFHVEGLLALRGVLERGFRVEGVLTLKPELAARRSGAGSYQELCEEFKVPLYEIENINDERSIGILKEMSPDIVFVIGWTQIVRPEALRLARLGMIGAHASLLPRDRGRAPINWALIKGEAETGNSLIWLAEGVDRGDIIDQTRIPITAYDTCATLYKRVAESNRDMILRALPKLLSGERPSLPQTSIDEPDLPGRKPKDGLIDWTSSSARLYDFVRALTKPYPGAFSFLDGRRWFIWKCALLPGALARSHRPGQVLGPVLSPEEAACGQMIACGEGAIVALELEGEGGEILSGRQLSDQRWEGKVWSND